MRFFDTWKFPGENSQGGDISSFDYLFLGNFVDRGVHSLETICLLMALKVKYPRQIHLLRGSHEDRKINIKAGLGDECIERLGDNIEDPESVFQKLNDMFEYLPLSCQIGSKLFAVHAGIGSRINRISDIEGMISKPVVIPEAVTTQDHQIVMDLLWSDPAEPDEDRGVSPHLERDPKRDLGITKFGSDRIEKFLKTNEFSLILRSHNSVPHGFEKFADDQLITINSCTNYCNKMGNDAAFFVVQKKFEITPKVIKPLKDSEKLWLPEQKRDPSPSKHMEM